MNMRSLRPDAMTDTQNRITPAAGNPNEDEITLGVLSTVQADAHVSQRLMARELGVALGLANAYLKRCVRKGYIKVQQVPRRRYAYYLTPQGFAEKARLTGEYLSSSLRFFRRSREQLSDLLGVCASRGWRRVALLGVSDLAEICTLSVHDADIVIVGIVDPASGRDQFCGLPVANRLAELGPVDAIVVTAMRGAEEMIAAHCGDLPPDRIMAPRVLRLGLTATATRAAAS